MEKGEKSSQSPTQKNLFDAASILGSNPFPSVSVGSSLPYAHLAHLPAFSMLGGLPAFPSPLFGGLGMLGDGLNNPLHLNSLAHSLAGTTGGAEWWGAASERVRRTANESTIDVFTGSLGSCVPPLFDGDKTGNDTSPSQQRSALQIQLDSKWPFFPSAFSTSLESPTSLSQSPTKSSKPSESVLKLTKSSDSSPKVSKSSESLLTKALKPSESSELSKSESKKVASPIIATKVTTAACTTTTTSYTNSISSNIAHPSGSVSLLKSSQPATKHRQSPKLPAITVPVIPTTHRDAKASPSKTLSPTANSHLENLDNDMELSDSDGSDDDSDSSSLTSNDQFDDKTDQVTDTQKSKDNDDTSETSRSSSPRKTVLLNIPHHIDGMKKKIIADQIRMKVQSKPEGCNNVTSLPVDHQMKKGRGRPQKSSTPTPVLSPLELQVQKKKQEELKLQLEAELKQQQLHLRMLKKAQAQKDKEAAFKSLDKSMQQPTNLQQEKIQNDKSKRYKMQQEILQLDRMLEAQAQAKSQSPKSCSPTESPVKQMSLNSEDLSGTESVPGTSKSKDSETPTNKFKTLQEKYEELSSSDDSSDTNGEENGDVNDSESSSDSDSESDDDSDSDMDNQDNTSMYGSETSSQVSRGDKRSADSSGDLTPKSKRIRITDEKDLRIPIEHGWQRETVIKSVGRRGIVGDVCYFAPCGKKLKTIPDVMRYLLKNDITDLSRENFTFSTRVHVGQFYEPRQGHDEVVLLDEDEVLERLAMSTSKRARLQQMRMKKRQEKALKLQETLAKHSMDEKLKHKLEEQEMAQKALEYKIRKKKEKARLKELHMKSKLEKDEEKRKQKDRLKALQEQEKVKRQEQLRLEREVRAHQLLEARQQHRDELEDIRIADAIQKAETNLLWYQLEREREMKRQQALLLKEQERQMKRQQAYMMKEEEREMKRQQAMMMKEEERERRRQHLLLVKALEARKKQEERDRLKEEKLMGKRMERERKMEQRKFELQLARELKKPCDDMELKDTKNLPKLPRIDGLKLSGEAYANSLMVLEFINNFQDSLGLDVNSLPTMSILQQALLNEDENAVDDVKSLLLHLFMFALSDPGVQNPKEAVTRLGQKITDIELNESVFSEVLRIFIIDRNGKHTEMSDWLNEHPFDALNPTKKSAILAFLCDELLSSRAVSSEIEQNLETVSTIRRDKWILEGKVRRLRLIQARKFNKPAKSLDTSLVNTDEDTAQSLSINKGGSDDEEKEDDSGNESDTNISEGEDEEPTSLEECEKMLEKYSNQHSQFRNKVLHASHKLRAVCFGQDRFKRTYWALPFSGGIFVEGMESGAPEDFHKIHNDSGSDDTKNVCKIKEEDIKKEDSCEIKVEKSIPNGPAHSDPKPMKDEPEQCITTPKTNVSKQIKSEVICNGPDKLTNDSAIEKSDSNPFLHTPDKSNFSDIFQLPFLTSKSETDSKLNMSLTSFSHTSSPSSCSTKSTLSSSTPVSSESKQGTHSIDAILKKDSAPATPTSATDNNFFLYPGLLPFMSPLSMDHMLKQLSEGAEQKPWFSILPRMPCDESSITHVTSTTTSTSSPRYLNSSLPFLSPLPFHPFQMQSPTFASFQMGQLQGTTPTELNTSATAGNTSGANESFKVPTLPEYKPCFDETEEYMKSVQGEAKPIPEDMQRSWWKTSDIEQLKELLKCLHPRGIRERHLQRVIQKYFDYACLACKSGSKEATSFIKKEEEDKKKTKKDKEETGETENQKSPTKVEEKSFQIPKIDNPNDLNDKIRFELEVAALHEVQALEERICSASLQSKSWRVPLKVDEDPNINLVCRSKALEGEKEYYPLQLGKKRIANLEANIERRYLKPPLIKNTQLSIPTLNGNNDLDADDSSQEIINDSDVPFGLKNWRIAVARCNTPAQLLFCVIQLQNSISWEKSIMKVICQICVQDNNEAELLLCDGCDKGYHTYCFKPKLETIPDGDWYCFECISKAAGVTFCLVCGKRTGKLVECDDCPRALHIDCMVPPLPRLPRKWSCPSCVTEKSNKKSKRGRRKKKDSIGCANGKQTPEPCPTPEPPSTDSAKKKEKSPEKEDVVPMEEDDNSVNDRSKDLTPCRLVLAEMEKHKDGWPFLHPVDLRKFPQYKKVIKKPMSFGSMKHKLKIDSYNTREDFAADARVIFDNCETFNEDDSEVGQAGHTMRAFFETRWKELCSEADS